MKTAVGVQGEQFGLPADYHCASGVFERETFQEDFNTSQLE